MCCGIYIKKEKMSNLLSENELQDKMTEIYKEEQIKVIQEKWDRLSNKDKGIVLEMIKHYYPDNAKLISESKWYNTVGDILGFIDPFGVVDLINGISYWRQGDKLFALLSWISVVPYIGDVIAKPVIGMFKLGGGAAKAFKAASLAGDAAKMAEIAKTSGPLGKLLQSTGKWGGKVLEPLGKLVGKVPGVGPGLVKGADDYVKLFSDANKTMKAGAQEAIQLTAKSSAKGLTKAEAKQLKDALKKATEFRGFRDYTGKGGFSAGMGRFWGNRGTRGLMRRTKWYLGLLDFLGLGNYVGPEELETQVENLDTKVAEYSNTEKAQTYANQDMQSLDMGQSNDDLWKLASQGQPLTQAPVTAPTKPSIEADDIFGALFA